MISGEAEHKIRTPHDVDRRYTDCDEHYSMLVDFLVDIVFDDVHALSFFR